MLSHKEGVFENVQTVPLECVTDDDPADAKESYAMYASKFIFIWICKNKFANVPSWGEPQ